jgi:dienelactone hydrolase
MKTLLISLVNIFLVFNLFGQYQIGHTTITFNDPSRTGGFGSGGGAGRQIQTEIYYPATVAGEDVALAADSFPVIVFGHGFAMSWNAYENIWEHYATLGYILAFPRTEEGLFPGPSHGDFGLDLNVVANRMQLENSTIGSIFEEHVRVSTAIMGHSMGGGASALAVGSNPNVKTYIGLAPAETTPSAISAAASITVPSIIFSGAQDGVTPSAEHHLPIYNGLSSSCKTFVSIIGGAHCYFANTNVNCDLGESLSSTGISISRQEQQDLTFAVLDPWLEYTLYGLNQGLSDVLTVSAASDYSTQSTCTPLSIETNSMETLFAYPNPTNGIVNISGLKQESTYTIIDQTGRIVLSGNTTGILDLSTLSNGSYSLKIGQEHLRLVLENKD